MVALNEKQKRFCEEYLVDLNATQAAMRAGYSKNTANEQGARLLANVSVSHYVQELRKKDAEATGITRQRVLLEYAKIAFADPRKFFDESTGQLKKVTDLDDETAAALGGMEVYEDVDKDGGFVIGYSKKIKISDKRAALDSLCRMQGWNAVEKKEVQHRFGLDAEEYTDEP